LLFIPIIQGFNITRKAQAETQAQSAARSGLERIAREVRQASYIFDNTATPVVVPLGRDVNLGPAGAPTRTPHILFAKLDLLPAATTGVGSGDILDPTTGKGLQGSPLRLPLAPGRRVVRYFLGLERNTTSTGAAATYANLYEFGAREFTPSDTTHNPLVLYRAEFDPSDPNLIDQTRFESKLDGEGGFDDPAFFYNIRVAPNGRSYAENWKAVSTPVVSGPRQDMLAWRRDQSGDILPDAPMRTLVQFAPGTVVGDTAVPGFLTAGAAEVPGAVPTMYTAKEAQWVLPFTVTFYRASAGRGTSRPSYGVLQLRFENEVQPDGSTRVKVARVAADGSLPAPDDSLYTVRQATTGRVLVKTPNLTFAVDPSRGRIETAFPPYAGTETGAPYIVGTSSPIAPSPYPVTADLVPTAMQFDTLDPAAGTGTVPTNQGIVAVSPLALGPSAAYFADGVSGFAGNAPSPMQIFGNVAGGSLQPGGGLMIAPGTERVLAPELSVGTTSLASWVTWHRVPAALGRVAKRASLIDDPLDGQTPARRRWSAIGGTRTYLIDQDTQPNAYARILFDEIGGPGLPARALTDPATIAPRRAYIAYLWQNNYARRIGGAQNGWPIDSEDRTLVDLSSASGSGRAAVVPEADVVKVDYSTRSQLVVNFGVNVYDTNTKRPTTLQLNDRIKVGNLGR
ncbi:MAG: hypothetical protein ACKO5K_14655, partial [Armatimonadota bacterium]